MRVSKIRFTVFCLWLTTTLVVLLTFAYVAMDGIDPDDVSKEFIPHAELMAGFMVPHLSLIVGFYVFGIKSGGQEQIVKKSTATVILSTSVLYHFIFITVVLYGIGFGGLGASLGNATASAIKILGLFSVLGITPLTVLFDSGKTEEQGK
jgi:hypothetical protein